MVEEADRLSYYTKEVGYTVYITNTKSEKVKRGEILKSAILQVAPIQLKNKRNVLCIFTQNRNFLLCLA